MNPIRHGHQLLVLGVCGTSFIIYRRTSDIQRSGRIFVIMHERWDSINDSNVAVDLSNAGRFDGVAAPTPYWWRDTPGSYHNREVVLSFADAHVGHYKWPESTTLGPVGIAGPRWRSYTDRDLAWLQERTAESK